MILPETLFPAMLVGIAGWGQSYSSRLYEYLHHLSKGIVVQERWAGSMAELCFVFGCGHQLRCFAELLVAVGHLGKLLHLPVSLLHYRVRGREVSSPWL